MLSDPDLNLVRLKVLVIEALFVYSINFSNAIRKVKATLKDTIFFPVFIFEVKDPWNKI